MNPLYLTVFHAIMGKRRRCPAYGKEHVVDRLDADRRFHCRHCGHRFTKAELKLPARPG